LQANAVEKKVFNFDVAFLLSHAQRRHGLVEHVVMILIEDHTPA
jgi:hypothetical protein